ncbi:helicase-related protein [Rothia mucilaginosa]|uniref:helicase-related protein n=1 Tax=Rothia mucilaginosa TaxID=43675 RepID=UPI0028E815C4|nr:helicase-related protein [Rothia mucilaginosa]
MINVFDNVDVLDHQSGEDAKLAVALKNKIKSYNRLDIATGYMNLSAWDEFADEIGQAPFKPGDDPVARILVGMVPRSITKQMKRAAEAEMRGDEYSEEIRNEEQRKQREKLISHLRDQLMAGGTSSSHRQALLTLKEHLESGRVQMKVYTKQALHGKLYVAYGPKAEELSRVAAFVGSSNFTRPGLHTNLELNVELIDEAQASTLKDWFEELWENSSFSITKEIIDLIDESWIEPVTPYDVYMKVCYELSKDARFGERKYALSPRLEHVLMDYQKSAAHTLARRLMRRGGTMLGDVVGLGKTLTAIAVASMLQNKENMRVLVLCPKNLEQMWKQHLKEYEIRGEVVRYSMATAELPELQESYRLVICDESHNLRNEKTQLWRAIKEYVSRNESRVLLLTATPFNLSFSDVKAQLALYIDENADLGITPDVALGKYPQKFDKREGNLSTLRAFEISEEPEDWKRLLEDQLVRRTRAYTKRQAPKETWTSPDGSVTKERSYLELSTGKFYYPDWVSQPLNHKFKENDPARFMEDDKTLDDLRDLRLPRYDISGYDNPNARHSPEDRAIIEAARSGRGNVRGFVLSGLYKRLSSSGYSFIQSLTRQLIRNELWIYAIDHQLSIPTGSFSNEQMMGLEDADAADFESVDGLQVQDLSGNLEQMYKSLVQSAPAQTKWVSSTVFTSRLLEDLQHDSKLIKAMLERFGVWQVETDSKLHALRDLIEQKHANDKVLVFTEYKDTAYYIAKGLKKLGVENVAAVAGDTPNPASYARRFSPVSNRVPTEQASDAETPALNGTELRVLVATDVLSEGQNLQDAHVVVNYDLPWAIIRLIQRAGRVDRVGQVHHEVNVYLISHQTVEKTLKLRSRIRERLESAAEAFGADQAFFTDMSSDDAAARTLEDFYSGNLDSEEPEEEGIDAVSEAAERWADFAKNRPEHAERIMKMQDKRLATRPSRQKKSIHPADENTAMVSYIRTNTKIDLFAIATRGDTNGSETNRVVSATEALGLFYAEYGTPKKTTSPEAYDLQQRLTQYALKNSGTSAGRLRNVRQQVWNRFHGKDGTSSFRTLVKGQQGEKVLNDLHSRPLRGKAESELRRLLLNNVSDEILLDTLVQMHQDKELLVKKSKRQVARVVCSLAISD